MGRGTVRLPGSLELCTFVFQETLNLQEFLKSLLTVVVDPCDYLYV